MANYAFHKGTTPLLISVPHAGTALPDGLEERFTAQAAGLPDTDWFVDRLYDFAGALGAGMLVARHSRYVIDLNRGRDDEALYARRGTGLIPLETFDGNPLYTHTPPDAQACQERISQYWDPYHEKLQSTLEQLRSLYGHAVLLDAHSIRQRVPTLFDGLLPDLNLGTNDGRSAAPALVETAFDALRASDNFSAILDGRFKGGYITRNYGSPGEHIHALQLEIAQEIYMNEAPPLWNDSKAQRVRSHLSQFVTELTRWRPQ